MKQQVLVGVWFTLSAIGCELATEFDRSKIGQDASVGIVDGGEMDAENTARAGGSIGPIPSVKADPDHLFDSISAEVHEYGRCHEYGMTTIGFPFPNRTDCHSITTDPCQHAARGVNDLGFDIDCTAEQSVGSMLTGPVTLVHLSDVAYGNRVCVTDASEMECCVGHLANTSIRVEEGCEVTAGDILADCGNTGDARPLPGARGDGTHGHFYCKDRDGNYVLLTHPDMWPLPLGGLVEPICSRVPENCSNGVDDNDDGRVDCYDSGCYRSENCRPRIDSFSCTSYRRGNALVTCDIYGDGFLNPPERIWIRYFIIESREFVDDGHLRVRGHWNCDAELGLIDVAYRHWYNNDLNVRCTSPTKACLDDVMRLQDDCTGVVCAASACGRMCNAGCAEEDPCAGVMCNTHPPYICVNASTRRIYADHGSCADGVCSYAAMNQVCEDVNPCTQNVCSGAGVCSWPPVANTCGARTCGSSPDGCYACGTCPTRANATSSCDAGTCRYTCRIGYSDCDGSMANGCEHSGACLAPDPCAGISCDDGNACTSDSCVGGLCRYDVVEPDCDARVCGISPNGCGSCGTCPDLANASERCISGSCQIGSCFGNYRDCDGIPSNGCEEFVGNDVNNCGSCGNVCPVPPNMVPTCVVGRCGRLCAVGWENCDGNRENGCEHLGPCAVCGPELCDGADNDCNGIADDGDNGCGGVCPLADLGLPCDGPDADRCNEGMFVCMGLNDTVCNDASGDSVEICGNAADEDCDGIINDPDVCPPPPDCPNGACGPGENCTNCPGDCGVCPPPGGCNNDGACNNGESCGSCPCDCCRACNPGQVATQACDPTPGVADLCSFVQSRTCTASCSWGAWGACLGRDDQPLYRFATERQCGPAYPPSGVQICAQITGLNRICLGGDHCIDGRITKSDGSSFSTSAVVTVWSSRGPHEIARRSCWPLSGNWIPIPNGAEIEELELDSPGSTRDVYIWIESYAGDCALPGEAAYYRSGYVTVQRCR